MSKDSGLFLCRDIYYSIEYDHQIHIYRSFFVHNNVVGKKGAVRVRSARNICEKDTNLHVKISGQKGRPKMLFWHYQAEHQNAGYLKNLTELTINEIRDWETQSNETNKILQ